MSHAKTKEAERRAPSNAEHRELLERAVHDLKNPLAVVRASLEWLEVELDPANRPRGAGVDDEVVDALRDASSATRRLVDIVDDLHLLARLDDDDDGRLGPLHLASIVETAMSHVAARARARNVVLTSGVPSNLSVRGDASLLGRGLVALLDALVRGAPSSPSPMVLAISATTNSTESASSTVDVVLGLRADGLGDDAPTPSSELPGAGLGVLLAVRAVRACGGAIVLEPGAFVPRVSVRLPVRGDDDVG